jgi:hypothetical protein
MEAELGKDAARLLGGKGQKIKTGRLGKNLLQRPHRSTYLYDMNRYTARGLALHCLLDDPAVQADLLAAYTENGHVPLLNSPSRLSLHYYHHFRSLRQLRQALRLVDPRHTAGIAGLPGSVSRTTIYRMPDISSLLAAALVSAVVALGVEWLAKPGLEVRKERILRRSRARDEVWRALSSILYAAATMKSAQTPTADIEAAGEGIVPATLALEESFRGVMLFIGGRAIDLASHYVGMVRGVMASDRTWREKGEMLFAGTALIMDVLAGPGQVPRYWVYRARWRYRRRRAGEAEAFLGIREGSSASHGDDARRPIQLTAANADAPRNKPGSRPRRWRTSWRSARCSSRRASSGARRRATVPPRPARSRPAGTSRGRRPRIRTQCRRLQSSVQATSDIDSDFQGCSRRASQIAATP